MHLSVAIRGPVFLLQSLRCRGMTWGSDQSEQGLVLHNMLSACGTGTS